MNNRTRKIIGFVLVFSMLLTMASIQAFAIAGSSFKPEGSDVTLIYGIENGEIIILDYLEPKDNRESNSKPLEGLKVVIPETIDGKPVTKIGEGAFQDSGAAEIILPSTLKEIGATAFASVGIKELVIPKNVELIDLGAFMDCIELKTVKIYNPNIKMNFGIFIVEDESNSNLETFTNSETIENFYFAGTKAQWEKVNTGAIQNGYENQDIIFGKKALPPEEVDMDKELEKVINLGAGIDMTKAKAYYNSKPVNVTYKVENGTWASKDTKDLTMEVEVVEGKIPSASIPTGMIADKGFVNGKWDKDPATTTVLEDTTFTYSFENKYKVIEGENLNFAKNSKDALRFRSNGAFEDFTGVKVDGKLVDKKNYKAWSGSTYVEFTKEYVNTLENGKHTITFLYTDGKCDASFTVDKNAVPQTSDNAFALGFALLSMVSLGGIVATNKKREK